MGVLYLIRHGQASFGSDDYDRLSALGVEQARILGASLALRSIRPTHVVSGDMLRHRQTAEACLAALGAGQPLVDAGWNEFDHEELLQRFEPRYKDRAEIGADMAKAAHAGIALRDIFGRAIDRWIDGEYDAEYRETWAQFRARSTAALERAVAASRARDATTLVFSSGGVVGSLVGGLLGLDDKRAFSLQWSIVNASITRVRVGGSSVAVTTFNEHQHLEHDRRLVTSR